MRKLIIILSITIIPFISRAQDSFSCGLGLGLDFSKDAYEGDINFTYYPVPTFGIRASLGMAGEYRDLYERWFDEWGYEHYSYADDYTWRFKFSPSIELRSPALIKFSDTSSLRLFANPGISLSPGAEGSHGAKWFTWQIRGGLEFDFGSIALQMGYRCTNFYLYSGNPFSRTEYEYDRDLLPDRYTHSGFLTFLIRF